MDIKERRKVYKSAVSRWGGRAQIIAAIEELSELTNQLAKYLNGKYENFANITDELADSRIMIEQVEYNLCLEKEVRERMEVKLKKLKKIISGEVGHRHKPTTKND